VNARFVQILAGGKDVSVGGGRDGELGVCGWAPCGHPRLSGGFGWKSA
jgi:hypothetical protein